jgi:hypothetical protein
MVPLCDSEAPPVLFGVLIYKPANLSVESKYAAMNGVLYGRAEGAYRLARAVRKLSR